MAVELAHVAAAALGAVELPGQRVGFASLAHEVVRGHPQLRWRCDRQAGGLVLLRQQRQHAVEQHLALDESRRSAAPDPGRRRRRGRRPRRCSARDRAPPPPAHACRARARRGRRSRPARGPSRRSRADRGRSPQSQRAPAARCCATRCALSQASRGAAAAGSRPAPRGCRRCPRRGAPRRARARRCRGSPSPASQRNDIRAFGLAQPSAAHVRPLVWLAPRAPGSAARRGQARSRRRSCRSACWTRRPLTNVPLALRSSRIRAPDGRGTRIACRRETELSSRRSSAASPRPTCITSLRERDQQRLLGTLDLDVAAGLRRARSARPCGALARPGRRSGRTSR